MKFGKRGDRRIIQQSFDKEKIFITKYGKRYNQYDAIQAANVDTDIYEVMKKYHCTNNEAAEIMKQKGGINGVYGEFVELQNEIQNFADIEHIKQKAEDMFYALPLEVRQKYGHNLGQFLTDVEKFKNEQKNIKDKVNTKDQGVKENAIKQ